MTVNAQNDAIGSMAIYSSTNQHMNQYGRICIIYKHIHVSNKWQEWLSVTLSVSDFYIYV